MTQPPFENESALGRTTAFQQTPYTELGMSLIAIEDWWRLD